MKKSVFITGAGSGIGLAATRELASGGYEVFATYRSEAGLRELDGIENVHPVRMDVTDAADLERAVATVAERVGEDGLYALVNNAGIGYAAPFEFAEEERGREVMEVNVMAPYRITRAFLPLLLAHGDRNRVKPRVVNVASWAGLMSAPYIPFYNASKFAVIGLTESMFYDLRLLGVHAVLAIPGTTRTPMLSKTTAEGTASLEAMPAEGRARYQQLFDHYARMGASFADSPVLASPEKVAHKLYRIVERPRPRFKNNLTIDASLVDRVLTRLPWRARVAMNTRMYRLDRVSA